MPPLVPPKPAHPPPANWPKEIHYLTQPFYSGVPPEVIALIQSKNPPPKHQPVTSVEIKFITDPKHPAYGQRGLFAKKKMVKGDLIVWYSGHIHLDKEPDPVLAAEREKSDYDLTLVPKLSSLLPLGTDPLPWWADLGLAVDAAKMGTESRCVNDYRGTPANTPPTVGKNGKRQPAKPKPNAFFHSLRTTTLVPPRCLNPDLTTPVERAEGKGELRMGIWVGAESGIAKGEEILISYGKSFWSSRKGGDDE